MISFFLIILLFKTLLIKRIGSIIVHFNRYYAFPDSFAIAIPVGKQNTLFFEPNLALNFNIITGKFYSWTCYSNTVSENTVELFTKKLEVEQKVEFIYIKDSTKELKFSYYLTNQTFNGVLGYLSLAKNFENYEFSLVHQMYNSKIIDSREFSLVPEEGKIHTLYIGKLPESFYKNYKKTEFSTSPNGNYWDFKLDNILLGDKELEFQSDNYTYYFQTAVKDIQIPAELFQMIIETRLTYFLGRYLCFFIDGRIQINLFCYEEYIGLFPNFIFVISGQKFVLNSEDIFECEKGKCFLKVRGMKEMSNEIIFGNAFINKYIISFDYDKKKIIIFTHQNSKIKPKSKIYLKRLYLILIILLFLMIFFLIITLYYK